MATIRISSLSLEYVRAQVAATVVGAAIDPSTDTVKMAFTAPGINPVTGDWHSAIWETVGANHYALCLVGPGGTVALPVGRYRVTVKVTDSPEVPVQDAGTLIVY